MASRIKGITIEIGGDTTKLQKALQKVDSSLKTTQTNLKDINKLLKLDPGNTELLKQKQVELSTAIEATSKRLETLREAYKQLNSKQGYGEMTEEQKALAREIAATEQNLDSLKEEYKEFGSVASQVLKTVGGKMQEVGEKMEKVGKDLSVKLTAPLVALGTVGINYNAQMEQYSMMFTTLTGSAEEADRIITQLQQDASKSPFDTESLVKANQYLISAGEDADKARKLINDLGNAIAATGGGSDELSRMAQNLQQIKNLGKASAQDIKQFANAGINIYGLLAETMGVSAEKVKEMDITYEQLAEALAKASQEGGKYYGAMEAQGKTLNGQMSATKESIQQLLGSITRSAMPIINKALKMVQKVVAWLSNLDEGTQQTILKVAAIVAAVGPALIVGGNVVKMLGLIVTAIGSVVGVLGGSLTIAIGAAIAIMASLIRNWDTAKKTFNDFVSWIKKDVTDLASRFSEKISSIIQNVKDLAKTFSDKLTSMWNGVVTTFTNIANYIKDKLSWISWLFGSQDWNLPEYNYSYYGGGGGNIPVLNSTMPQMNMATQTAAPMTVNMTVNGGNVSPNELADIVVDKLTTTIRRNNQRW